LKQIGISEQETSEDYTEAFEVNFALHYYNFAKFDYFCGTKQQKHTEMAKYTKQELEEINRQKQALLLLLLKKTRTTRKAVIEAAVAAGVLEAEKMYVRHVWRSQLIVSLSEAIKPPMEASDFEKVPMMRSTSSVSPKWSQTPLP
jgi:hypothetical protein